MYITLHVRKDVTTSVTLCKALLFIGYKYTFLDLFSVQLTALVPQLIVLITQGPS